MLYYTDDIILCYTTPGGACARPRRHRAATRSRGRRPLTDYAHRPAKIVCTVCVYIHMYMHTHTHIHIHTHVHVHIHMHLQVSLRFGCRPPTSPPENRRGDRSIQPISILRFWISESLTQFTVPQKGYAKRGSKRQITYKSLLSHLKVTFSWNPF